MSAFLERHLFRILLAVGFAFAVALAIESTRGPERLHERAAIQGLAVADVSVREIRCAACRALMTSTLRKSAGVSDLETASWGMAIAYDRSRTTSQQLVSIVTGLGFHAELRPSGT